MADASYGLWPLVVLNTLLLALFRRAATAPCRHPHPHPRPYCVGLHAGFQVSRRRGRPYHHGEHHLGRRT